MGSRRRLDGEPLPAARVMDVTIDPGALLVRLPRSAEQ